MKKSVLFFIASLFSVFSLTSCFEGNNVSEGQSVGVLVNSGYSAILRSHVGNLGGPSIDALSRTDMEVGRCYIFSYRFDGDLPENAPNVVEANGYSTVSILAYNEINKYYLSSYLTDTAIVISEEMPVLSGCEGLIPYISNHLFMTHVVNQPTDLRLDWDMSYDANSMFTEEDNNRFYDIYIRATRNGSSERGNADIAYLNAYNVGGFMTNAANTEKELLGNSYVESSSVFTIRFNFVSDIDEDNNITWKSQTERINIAAILAN